MIQFALTNGENVVVDDMNLTYKDRDIIIQLARKYKANIICYQMAVTPQECLKHNSTLDVIILDELNKAYEPPLSY